MVTANILVMNLDPGPRLPVHPTYPFFLPVIQYHKGHSTTSAWWLSGELPTGGYVLHLAATTALYPKGKAWKIINRRQYRFLRVLSHKSFITLCALEHLGTYSNGVLCTYDFQHLYPRAIALVNSGWEPDTHALAFYK